MYAYVLQQLWHEIVHTRKYWTHPSIITLVESVGGQQENFCSGERATADQATPPES